MYCEMQWFVVGTLDTGFGPHVPRPPTSERSTITNETNGLALAAALRLPLTPYMVKIRGATSRHRFDVNQLKE